MYKEIRETKDYTSLDDIVDKACAANFPKKATVFKVKSRAKSEGAAEPEQDDANNVHSVDQ